MSRKFAQFTLLLLIALLAFSLVACGSDEEEPEAVEVATQAPATAVPTEAPATEAPTEAPATEAPTEVPATEVPAVEEPAVVLIGDPLRGGLLYDAWWKTLGLDAPEGDHPLWATQDTNTRSGADTWRCKECHGWDYQGADGAYGGGSHSTGFTGISQWSGGDASEILAALTSGDHDFSAVMDDQALTDIALFISEKMLDDSQVIGGDKMAIGGDAADGEALFRISCSGCHGPQGLAINFKSTVTGPEYIGGLSGGNPWEFFHKMRFGQPGEPDMTSALAGDWTLEAQASVLAFAQSLPTDSPRTHGGLLYDKWWAALGIDAPEGDQPLWESQDTNERNGSDTWRCKECHGWDYQGADGAYGSGSHFTGFTGVLGSSSLSAEELSAWLDGTTNSDHDFSAYLDEAAISMMVSFLGEGTVDMTAYINEDKSVNGDAATGEGLFAACTRCHGDDGRQLNFGDDSDPEYLGGLANGNPWEVLHKAANGQPAKHMPSGLNLGWSWQELADLLAFLQTLESE